MKTTKLQLSRDLMVEREKQEHLERALSKGAIVKRCVDSKSRDVPDCVLRSLAIKQTQIVSKGICLCGLIRLNTIFISSNTYHL